MLLSFECLNINALGVMHMNIQLSLDIQELLLFNCVYNNDTISNYFCEGYQFLVEFACSLYLSHSGRCPTDRTEIFLTGILSKQSFWISNFGTVKTQMKYHIKQRYVRVFIVCKDKKIIEKKALYLRTPYADIDIFVRGGPTLTTFFFSLFF